MRFRLITKNQFQLKFMALILLSIVVPVFLIGGCLYYLIFQILAEQLGIPESIAENLNPVLYKVNFLLIVGLPPVFAVIFWWALALTHRVVGPFKRVEEDLRKITEKGEYSIRLKVRKKDYIRPMAELINKLIEKLEKR
ncbi:MAG: hypothetical protein NG740_02870 [Omnitrophica bacterium]|nr:hypothetical protein [Candidatus Omnitrophota bacterium]